MKNPAPIIRLAASIMESRARAATPGPWAVEQWHDTFWITAEDELGPITMDMSQGGVMIDPMNREGGRADAQHMAGWSPGMAIMIARWLYEEAAVVETLGENFELWTHTVRGHGALTVAAEYLRITDQVFEDPESALPVLAPWSWN